MSYFFSSRRRHTRLQGDWSSDVCSSDPVARIARLSTLMSLSTWCSVLGLGALLLPAPAWAQLTYKGTLGQEFRGFDPPRSEERRVGKEWRSRWRPDE